MELTDQLLLKIVLAIVVGGVIGIEREFRTGSGLRTLMLICLGSTLFTIYSSIFAFGEGDPRRIAAAVVTGVGFLGAGMILRHRGSVFGLTTAATVWLVAALGTGIGLGEYWLVLAATILVLIVLWGIPLFLRLQNARRTFSYEALSPPEKNLYNNLEQMMEQNHLVMTEASISREASGLKYVWKAYGRPDDHTTAQLALLEDDNVVEFRVI